MIKKALVALLSSAILATTVVSGGVATPTVAYAEETRTIHLKNLEFFQGYYLEYSHIDRSGKRDTRIYNGGAVGRDPNLVSGYYFNEFGSYDNIDDVLVTISDIAVYLGFLPFQIGRILVHPDEPNVYYFEMPDLHSYFYRLPTDMTNGTLKIRASCCEYTLTCKNGIYKFNSVKPVNTEVSDMTVCKHQSAGNVTLSQAEKKGTLKVTKADIKTATKLDRMLKTKKALTLKVKAASKVKAKSQLEKLQKLVGHANTYGIQFWADDSKVIPDTAEINTSKLKKSGNFYTLKISKKSSTNYTSLCNRYKSRLGNEGYTEVVNGYWTSIGTGYTFPKGTHLCDCSDIVKGFVIVNEINDDITSRIPGYLEDPGISIERGGDYIEAVRDKCNLFSFNSDFTIEPIYDDLGHISEFNFSANDSKGKITKFRQGKYRVLVDDSMDNSDLHSIDLILNGDLIDYSAGIYDYDKVLAMKDGEGGDILLDPELGLWYNPYTHISWYEDEED